MTDRPSRERKRTGRTTMKDVADRAGVSMAAVSIAINGKVTTKVSQQTRKHILAVAEQLDYRPNAAARQLSTATSSFVGLVADSIATTPFAGALISGAQDAAWEHDQILLVANTETSRKAEHEAVTMMLEHNVRGVVYSSYFHHAVQPPPELTGTPAVLANCYVEGDTLPAFVPDEVQGGHTATMMLLEAGHRRIAFINGNYDAPSASGRLLGYRTALEGAGETFAREFVVAAAPVAEGGYEAAHKLLQSPQRPTAIFCYNDRQAMGLYDAARELGLSIPKDLAVVGFDNQEIVAAHLRPGLSTVALPHYEMGYQSMKRLLAITPTEPAPDRMMLRCPPIYRDSIAPPGGK